MPAVPPYSSTTMASWSPCSRSMSSSGSSRIVSGTRSGGTISADTGTSSRRSCGTAMARFTCTTPSMSSQSSPVTGKRECPVRRASRTTSSAVAVRSIDDARARGLITSAAVCSPKPRDLVTSLAVPASSVPAAAERRTSEASSCGVRAPDSSSRGVMPSARRNRLAEPLSTKISGRATSAKPRTGIATTLAVASGAEMPRNCGSSSPKTIENRVAITRATTAATDSSVEPVEPGGLQRRLEQHPERRGGEEAEDERRQRDADLGCGELRREPSQRPQDDLGAGVPGVHGLLHGRPVERDQRELGGHEDGGTDRQPHTGQHQQPFGHSAVILGPQPG